MFIYNISLKLEWEIVEEWLRWMREEHIHEVLGTGCFYDYKLFKLMGQDDSEGPTFVVQYFCDKKIDYLRYKKEHAPQLQQKGIEKFGNKFVAFRSVMELI
jgi:hypothetical protein